LCSARPTNSISAIFYHCTPPDRLRRLSCVIVFFAGALSPSPLLLVLLCSRGNVLLHLPRHIPATQGLAAGIVSSYAKPLSTSLPSPPAPFAAGTSSSTASAPTCRLAIISLRPPEDEQHSSPPAALLHSLPATPEAARACPSPSSMLHN
jgi:hypothetical protein